MFQEFCGVLHFDFKSLKIEPGKRKWRMVSFLGILLYEFKRGQPSFDDLFEKLERLFLDCTNDLLYLKKRS